MSSTDQQVGAAPRPTRAELLADFGSGDFSVPSLFQFCFVPLGRLSLLKELAPDEAWGEGGVVLLKYLGVHLRLAIEQGCYVWNEGQIVLRAGQLRSSAGVPLYLGLVQNHTSDENPWALNWVGDRPNCAELPERVDLGVWPKLDKASELVLGFNVERTERLDRIPSWHTASIAMRTSLLIGACHFALHRDLAVAHAHNAVRGFYLPLFLSSQDDLCAAPDLVASVIVHSHELLVHSILDPHIAYAPSRAVVERPECLPNWLLEAWTLNEPEQEDL